MPDPETLRAILDTEIRHLRERAEEHRRALVIRLEAERANGVWWTKRSYASDGPTALTSEYRAQVGLWDDGPEAVAERRRRLEAMDDYTTKHENGGGEV